MIRRGGGDSPEGEYERYRAVVLGMLGKRFPRLDPDDRLAIYHDVWARVLAKRERGERIHSLRSYLLASAGAEALHLLSRDRDPTPLDPDDPRLAALVDRGPSVEDQVVTSDEARMARDLLETLDERQRDVLKLRWDLQLTGAEIRAALGLSARQYQRLSEEGAAAVAERVAELESGRWSRRVRSLLVACLVEVPGEGGKRVGIATRAQRAEAQRLLESDPHVAALYAEIRRRVGGVAALLPLPAIAVAGARSPVERLAELVSDARGQLSSAFDGVKQGATSLYIRASDPSLLAGGPRPGAAAIAVTGALAVGGGAYGAYDTVKPQPKPDAQPAPRTTGSLTAGRSPRTVEPNHPPRKPANRSPRRPRPTKPPIPPTSTRQPTATPAPPQPSPLNQTPQPTPPQPTEFGFEN